MIPVKRVFSHGRTLIAERIPLSGVASGMHLRNRTALLWNRKFSKGIFVQQHHKYDDIAITHGKKAVVFTGMRLVFLTSLTVVLGTIITKKYQSGQLQRTQGDEDDEISTKSRKIRIFDNNWLFFCYSTLPLNAISRLWGQFNHLTLPVWFRYWGYRYYSYLFNVNMDEMVDPELKHYKNLAEFFYRDIKPEARPIAQGDDVVVCPSDGTVLQLGVIASETGEIEQVKGMTYSIKEFLGTHSHPLMSKSESSLDLSTEELKHREFAKLNQWGSAGGVSKADIHENQDLKSISFKNEGDTSLKKPEQQNSSKTVKLLSELTASYPTHRISSTEPQNTELYFVVIYLSPGDYHHYHSPVNWVCKLRRHFPGDLFSVSPYFQTHFPNLFVLNERVALLGHWKHGFFSMTPVGATNVGSIKLNFDTELVTNKKRKKHMEPHTCYEATYANTSKILGGVPLVKGEEMGGFELGSTVVLCFEAPENFKYKIKVGDKVKMGQELGSST